MEFIWIVIAFACGFIAKQVNMPPLVGYLLAGFGLHAYGVEPHDNLETLANLGITLMLFTIGLKINIRSLLKPTVWAGSVIHMSSWVVVGSLLLKGFAMFGVTMLEGLSGESLLLIAFALSFSSTVCVVKLLEDKTEMKANHGKLAVGILIMQDIVAVGFLVLATGKIPDVYALALLLLWPARKPLGLLLTKAGHGELLPLVGLLLAFGGYELFNAVNLKGDLGALIAGLMLSQHTKANELAKSLLNFKDIFLIGFFLNIGFAALPTVDMLMPLLVISFILIIKGVLLFHILALLKAPGRSMFLGSMILTNYSEFGLIVMYLCVENSWISNEWLVIVAMAVSISFVFTSIFYEYAHRAYAFMRIYVKRFERQRPKPLYHEQLKQAEVLVIGMGRVGRSSYDVLHHYLGDKVWGVESDADKARRHQDAGRHVIIGDAEDADFWETRELWHIKLIMLAMPSITDMKDITQQLKLCNFTGQVAAIARYEDERRALVDYGVDNVFNHYAEVGAGFAEECLTLIAPESKSQQEVSP
ncbi:cation:proton antiporter [Bermanella marisrubri]|uniref:Putative glutathione-regulated potassium-efflux system protein n=1 Tax=Bermanella marisrubri TaxID=207949 RepID=Q1N3N9_9GAMM|nr:cation:proton antiporter [Bermanella marisrubri]EAT12835.1 putative glutathione-regulated potassium-efflux system protein [Oceanobacter sp. RED65] [Bermanella marisrubri]QIZ83156.1 cation:proton antiporter [Bermanella marisrubri]